MCCISSDVAIYHDLILNYRFVAVVAVAVAVVVAVAVAVAVVAFTLIRCSRFA